MYTLATAAQMKELDRVAIEERGIPSLDLMEAAATSVAEKAAELLHKKGCHILNRASSLLVMKTGGQELTPEEQTEIEQMRELVENQKDTRIAVFCGPGNNGGDGVAAARLLMDMGFSVRSFLIGERAKMTHVGTLYLSVIRDLYDNSIVSYKTGTEQNINLVLQTIREAKKKEKVTAELQLHSDQGFQYTSHGYYRLTKSYNITPSMSRKGNPYDNALAENFFSILKTECIYRIKLKTFDEARLIIDEYIHFYNHERIQLKTKLTPLEKRCQYVA